jgi:hypothetical protein
MKVKLFNLLDSKNIIEKLGLMTFNDGVTSYRLYKNIKIIGAELEDIEKARLELVKRYGTPKENGDIEVLDDKKDAYFKEFNIVLEQEVEINILPINPEKLSGISAFDLLLVEWMFEPENKEG